MVKGETTVPMHAITSFLERYQKGERVRRLAPEAGVSVPTFYNWINQYMKNCECPTCGRPLSSKHEALRSVA
jgi:transposase-like protein